MKNKNYYTLYGIFAFWIVVLIAIFAFHITLPARLLFLMAFLCVGWMAWWTINTVRGILLQGNVEDVPSESIKNHPENNDTKNALN